MNEEPLAEVRDIGHPTACHYAEVQTGPARSG